MINQGLQPAKYHEAIDGLRALAIVGVLLFHFGLGPVPGGFAGVDVFFVISGYLMTKILVRQIASPGNLGLFYARRFWRIAPAYYAATAVTLLAGAIVLLPDDAGQLGGSAVAAAAFSANVFFSTGNGYFDTASIYKPLLHLWSLSVEAQFYLIWPFVIFGILRLPQRWHLPAMVSICVASLIACQILGVTDTKVAFFAMPARLWQFGVGGIVAFWGASAAPQPGQYWHGHIVIAGLAVIVATMLMVGEYYPWPAPWAVPVTVSTAAIIRFGQRGSIGRTLLTAKPVRFVGQISYSLYLVHWPIIVFLGYGRFPDTPLWLRFAAALASIPLAFGLYRFVEVPLRAWGNRASIAKWHLLAGLSIPVFLALAGIIIYLSPQRFSQWPAVAQELPAQLPDFNCMPRRGASVPEPFCQLGAPGQQPSILLWGDSHALQFVPGFVSLFSGTSTGLAIAAKDSCPPVIGLNRVSNSLYRSRACLKANDLVMQSVLRGSSIHTVILAARWAFYAETTRFGDERGGRAFLVENDGSTLSIATSQQLLRAHLLEQVQQLMTAGKNVVLVAQVPEMGFDAARCVSMRLDFDKKMAECAIDQSRVTARQAFVTNLFADIAAATGAKTVDPKNLLCSDNICKAVLQGQPAYRDDNHLSSFAARTVVLDLFGSSEGGSAVMP